MFQIVAACQHETGAIVTTELPSNIVDQWQIFELVRMERFWRDSGDWTALAAAFTDDAMVRTTWFYGTAADFAEQSRVMAVNGRHSKHPIWPIYAKVNGDRALVESRAEIQNRSVVNDIPVDMVQYCRFFSRVRRTPVGWRLASFEAIYGKDTITTVNPSDSLPISWDVLTSPRDSYRIWAWAMAERGYTIPDDLLGDDRPDQLKAFYAAEDQWLLGGDT